METLKNIFIPFGVIKQGVDRAIWFFYILLVLLIWWFVVPEKGLFPNLSAVLGAWGELWNNGLFEHILKTLKLCGMAAVIGVTISALFAYGSRVPILKPLAYILTLFRYNPIQGFTLFFAFMTGGGRALQVNLLVIFVSFYFITGLLSMIAQIPDADYIRRQAQGMSNWKILWKVVILDRLDFLFDVIRQNLAMMFMMIVSVEAMDKSQGGIGALIVDTNRGMNFPKIFALQLTILCIGISVELILRGIYNAFPANQKSEDR